MEQRPVAEVDMVEAASTNNVGLSLTKSVEFFTRSVDNCKTRKRILPTISKSCRSIEFIFRENFFDGNSK